MCRVLLSINPEYVEKIFSGEKEFEFRKNRCKSDANKMVIYCTSPVMKVVGEVSVKRVLVNDPKEMWQEVKDAAGVTREFFDGYYHGRKNAVAFQLGDIERYAFPKELEEFGVSHAPQSFVYLE